jgi:hypothetical protein
MSSRTAIMTAALVALSAAFAAQARSEVQQSIPPAVTSAKQPLSLSDTQRARIESVLSRKDTSVSFALKNAKSTKSFEPSVGAKIPKGLKPLAFPQPLIGEMPQLKQYAYLKFKDQTLIVNPMTRKIIDILPQT